MEEIDYQLKTDKDLIITALKAYYSPGEIVEFLVDEVF